MSKKLPYFQFEPAQYLSGDILLCSYKAQGVFVHLQAIYWQRDCHLTLDKANRLISESVIIDELIDEGIIKLEGEFIVISFLDEQFGMLAKRKERLSAAGLKGAQAKKDKAMNKPPLSDASTTHKQPEEIRQDNTRKDKIIQEESELVFPFNTDVFKIQWNLWKDYKKDEHKFSFKSHISEQAALKELGNLTNNEQDAIKIIHQSIANGYKGLFQLKNQSNGTKQRQSNSPQDLADAYARIKGEVN